MVVLGGFTAVYLLVIRSGARMGSSLIQKGVRLVFAADIVSARPALMWRKTSMRNQRCDGSIAHQLRVNSAVPGWDPVASIGAGDDQIGAALDRGFEQRRADASVAAVDI